MQNAGMVIMCEVLVDVIKHSFLAKFNEIKPGAYSDFLQALCKQVGPKKSSIILIAIFFGLAFVILCLPELAG